MSLCTFCPSCNSKVEILSRSEAARVLEVPIERLDRLISANLVHVIQTVIGSQKVCKESLFQGHKIGEIE